MTIQEKQERSERILQNTKKRYGSDNVNIQVKIRRFNPAHDKCPYWQTYEVPVLTKQNTSVLTTLQYIFEHLDSSLAFSGPCERGLCRVCRAIINGKIQLICKTFLTEDITIEPLTRGKIIRDLVIERLKSD